MIDYVNDVYKLYVSVLCSFINDQYGTFGTGAGALVGRVTEIFTEPAPFALTALYLSPPETILH